MQYEEFIDRVWQRSVSYSADAQTASSAILRVLGERSNGCERLTEVLRRQPSNRRIIFSPNNLGCEEEGIEWFEEALGRVSAVMRGLGDAIGLDEMEDVCRRFPSGFDLCFEPRDGRRARSPGSERA